MFQLMVKRFCGKDTVVSSHTEGHPERFTELNEEDEREGRDRDGQEEKKQDSRGERQIYTVLCSLSVLHSPEHPQRFTELD